MKKRKLYIMMALTLMVFHPHLSFSQVGTECIKEIIMLNDLNDHRNDTSINNKCIKVAYSVRVTDQDNETTVSNVKVYKNGTKMHFSSEQVTIIQDDKEALMILPQQKLIFLNSMDKRMADIKLSQAFFEVRNSMLDSCEVSKFDVNTNGNKVAVLKMPKSKFKRNDLHINFITYEYNMVSKKIISVKIDYDSEYKMKQMFTVYKEFVVGAEFSFAQPKAYALDKKGNLLPKFAGWEFIDNRELTQK
jgi:hypothetical protein